MARCIACGSESRLIARALSLCGQCLRTGAEATRAHVDAVHAATRREFGLPTRAPRSAGGVSCALCANACRMSEGERGYCGVRRAERGRVVGGSPESARVSWYLDPLPTNCVASWICPADTEAGYPTATDTRGPELGYFNLAVFYQACSFNCLYCQNWHYRQVHDDSLSRSAEELAAAVDARTRCICYFGGDPGPQVQHALAAARAARERAAGRILRVCWETNGSMARRALREMAEVSLASGGCIKFDLKAWHPGIHRALTGADNRATLANFEAAAELARQRTDPPLLVASTLLVPGYVEEEEVAAIGEFVASLDRAIPYSLLAFHPDFRLPDLPVTSRRQAESCQRAAREAGVEKVHVGNVRLLMDS
jgi:pyruvate formate lyase activating enzyme